MNGLRCALRRIVLTWIIGGPFQAWPTDREHWRAWKDGRENCWRVSP